MSLMTRRLLLVSLATFTTKGTYILDWVKPLFWYESESERYGTVYGGQVIGDDREMTKDESTFGS